MLPSLFFWYNIQFSILHKKKQFEISNPILKSAGGGMFLERGCTVLYNVKYNNVVHFMPKSSGNQEIVIKSSWNIYKCIIQRTHLLFCVLHSNWRVVSFYSVNQDKRQVCMYIVFWYVTILCFCSGP